MTGNSNLISAIELQSFLEQPDFRIIDCRFDLADPSAGRRAYLERHIAGAVYADLDNDLSAPAGPDTGRHPLPDSGTFASTLARLGIGNTTEVVVYDGGSGAVAARAWWLLRWLGHRRVRLLDGGFEQWLASNGNLASGDENTPLQTFEPNPRDNSILTTKELSRDLAAIAEMRLIDAREPARFRGEVEPIDPIAGHVPGSINLPYPVSLNDDGTWKTKADLEALWLSVLGDDRQGSWAAMCGSGVTACHLAISAIEAGFAEPRLYVGSWSEWIRDPARPIGLGIGSNPAPEPADMA